MAITFELPLDIEKALQEEVGDVSRAAKEAFVIEAYRGAKLSLGEVAQVLGMGVVQALDWLGKREVPLNYSREDLEADRRTLEALFPRPKA